MTTNNERLLFCQEKDSGYFQQTNTIWGEMYVIVGIYIQKRAPFITTTSDILNEIRYRSIVLWNMKDYNKNLINEILQSLNNQYRDFELSYLILNMVWAVLMLKDAKSQYCDNYSADIFSIISNQSLKQANILIDRAKRNHIGYDTSLAISPTSPAKLPIDFEWDQVTHMFDPRVIEEIIGRYKKKENKLAVLRAIKQAGASYLNPLQVIKWQEDILAMPEPIVKPNSLQTKTAQSRESGSPAKAFKGKPENITDILHAENNLLKKEISLLQAAYENSIREKSDYRRKWEQTQSELQERLLQERHSHDVDINQLRDRFETLRVKLRNLEQENIQLRESLNEKSRKGEPEFIEKIVEKEVIKEVVIEKQVYIESPISKAYTLDSMFDYTMHANLSDIPILLAMINELGILINEVDVRKEIKSRTQTVRDMIYEMQHPTTNVTNNFAAGSTMNDIHNNTTVTTK